MAIYEVCDRVIFVANVVKFSLRVVATSDRSLAISLWAPTESSVEIYNPRVTILEAVLSFAVVAGLLTLIPGLDTALVLRSSLTKSTRFAWETALGVATGAMVWGIAAAVGLSALLAASEALYRIITFAGIGYLLYLGVTMLVRSIRSFHANGRLSLREAATSTSEEAAALKMSTADNPWRGWLMGTTTNLLNPKVGVFYIATIPQFLPADVSPLLMGILLAGVHAALTLAWFTLIILASRFAAKWLSNQRSVSIIDGMTAVILMIFGGTMLTEQVHEIVTP